MWRGEDQGAWVSGGFGRAVLTVGFDGLRGFFQI